MVSIFITLYSIYYILFSIKRIKRRYIIKNQIQKLQNEDIYYVTKNFLLMMIKVITDIIFDILRNKSKKKKQNKNCSCFKPAFKMLNCNYLYSMYKIR